MGHTRPTRFPKEEHRTSSQPRRSHGPRRRLSILRLRLVLLDRYLRCPNRRRVFICVHQFGFIGIGVRVRVRVTLNAPAESDPRGSAPETTSGIRESGGVEADLE